MAKKNGIELYQAKQTGDVVAIKTKLEELTNEHGMKPPRRDEILTIPGTWSGKPRRIVVYPEGSPRPFPLARGDKKLLAPDAYRTSDVENIEGNYWPNMLKRAFGLAAKMQVKDWVIIAVMALNILLSIGTLYLVYKIAKYASLV